METSRCGISFLNARHRALSVDGSDTSRLSELGGAAVGGARRPQAVETHHTRACFNWLSTGCTSSSSWSRCRFIDPIWMMWQVLPGTGLINHHARAIPVALLPFVAVAATRVAQLQHAHQPFLLLLLGCELCLLSPMGIFLPSTSSHHSSLLQAHQPTAGRWLHLPMSGPGHSFQLPLWLQHQHQQPLWLWPNRPGYPPTAPKNETIKWLLHPNASKLPTDLCLPKTVRDFRRSQAGTDLFIGAGASARERISAG